MDLAANYNEIGERVKLNLASYMASMGIELMSLTIANISLPDEVNAAIDKRGAVGALGSVLNQYSQMQAADALKAAAENQGGTGTMMGMMMGGQLGAFGSQQAFQQQQATSTAAATRRTDVLHRRQRTTTRSLPSRTAPGDDCIGSIHASDFGLDDGHGRLASRKYSPRPRGALRSASATPAACSLALAPLLAYPGQVNADQT